MRSFSRLVLIVAVALALPMPMVLASTRAPSDIDASNAVAANVAQATTPASVVSQSYDGSTVSRLPVKPARLSSARHHLGHGRLALRNRLAAARMKQAALALHRTSKPVRLAAAGLFPQSGFIVDPDAVQRKNSLAQASACDSILCSGYIIMGVGF